MTDRDVQGALAAPPLGEILAAYHDDEMGYPSTIRIQPSGTESINVTVNWRIHGVLTSFTYAFEDSLLFDGDSQPAEPDDSRVGE